MLIHPRQEGFDQHLFQLITRQLATHAVQRRQGHAHQATRKVALAKGKAQERNKTVVVRQRTIKVKDREHAGLRHGFVGNHIGHKYVLAEIHILFTSLPALPSQSFYPISFFLEPVG